MVGSLLRPAALKRAREQFARGEIDATDLREAGGGWETGMRRGRQDYLEVVADPEAYERLAVQNLHGYIQAVVAEFTKQANR